MRVIRGARTRRRQISQLAGEDVRGADHPAAGSAENGIAFASAVGRMDEAFALAEAYYFGRGFVVPDLRFTREQGTYTPQRDRLTALLFIPPASSMHADPRFEGLITELGLTRYWAQSGHQPDYRGSNS